MNKFYIFSLVVLLAFSCSKDESQSSKTILPLVQTMAIQAVRAHQVIVTGKIARLSTDSITDHGFVYSTESISTLKQGTKISLGKISELKEFSSQISGLEKAKQYYVRAYASTADSTVYSNQATLTTKNVNEWLTYPVNGWPEYDMIGDASGYGLVTDGKGYVGFGQRSNANGTTVTPLYEFDPSTNALTRLPDYPATQTYYTRRFLLGSKIYVLYGKSVWRFDITTNEWKQMTDLPANLSNTHTYTLYGQGYVLGTNENSSTRAAQIWQYNEADDVWNLFSTVPSPYGGFSPDIHGVAVVNNKVYILTGLVTSNPKFYEYDPTMEKYTLRNTPPVTLPEGSIGNFGVSSSAYGFFFLRDSGIIWQYNPEEDTWVKMDRPYSASMSPVIIDDTIYFFGNYLYVYTIE